MNYSNGKKVMVGDEVRLAEDCFGIVVGSIDDDEYAPGYPKKEWSYLQIGVLVSSAQLGLVHFPQADENLRLVRQRQN